MARNEFLEQSCRLRENYLKCEICRMTKCWKKNFLKGSTGKKKSI